MTKQRKTRKIQATKRLIKQNDQRLKDSTKTAVIQKKKREEAVLKRKKQAQGKSTGPPKEGEKFDGVVVHRDTQTNSNLFFSYNTSLGPPYRIIIDTNFFHWSMEKKLDLHQNLMDCLLSQCIVVVTDCIIAELEKLGPKYRLALKIAKDPRNERWPCTHKGTYADDCIVHRCTVNKCFIVATMDGDLKRRVRKIPGVPIMYITNRRYSIERFPDTNNAPDF